MIVSPPKEVTSEADQFTWEDVDGRLQPVLLKDGKAANTNVVWAPLPGSQQAFVTCPTFEVLLGGTRGGGKTESLLMDFAADVGKGYGAEWRGILFRRTYPELEDVVNKSLRWFPLIFPGARFNRQKLTWTFPAGETLKFRHMAKPTDYWAYHGHAYPWQGWEELTNWANDICYRMMFSCARSDNKNIPTRIRATTNPSGVGHGWVKERFGLPLTKGRIVGPRIVEPGEDGGPPRVRRAIHSDIAENIILLHADPGYLGRLRDAAANEAEYKAWRWGDWDVIAGGFFSDVWDARASRLAPFDLPKHWRLDRSFDWGEARPFSVCWWAESDGSDVTLADGSVAATVRGDIFHFAEWYGWNGRPNEGCRKLATEVAAGIVERELEWGIHGRVKPGPADTMIWTENNGNCVATDMQKQVRVNGKKYPGVRWTRADKGPGSRENGWQVLRRLLKHANPTGKGPRENPGLFVFDTCKQWLRTVPVLPRHDIKPADVDTDAEDHIGDATRYRISTAVRRLKSGRVRGLTH